MRSYHDVYGCQKCPVSKYCGTMISCMRLCHSYTEDTVPFGKQIMPVSMLEQISFANVVVNKKPSMDNITAKCIKESDDSFDLLKHDLRVGKEYKVESIDMSQSYTFVRLFGKYRMYNSVYLQFYEDGKPIDIYHDKRFNKYL